MNSSFETVDPAGSWNHPISEFIRVYRQHHVSGTTPLEDLIYVSCDRYASNPRDFIYALLGLVKEQFYEPLEADYLQLETFAFQRAIVSIITAQEDLEFLLNIVLAQSRVREVESFSWAHNFAKRPTRVSTNTRDVLRCRYHITHEGATAGRKYCGIRNDTEAKNIKLTGTVVGSVEESQMPYTDCHSTLVEEEESVVVPLQDSHNDFIVPWLLQAVQKFTIVTKEAWSERFSQETVDKKIDKEDVWRIVTKGMSIYDLKMTDTFTGSEYEWGVLQRCSTVEVWQNMLSQEASGSGVDIDFSIAKSFYRIIVGVFSPKEHWKGCLFTTTNGYVASANKETQSGDVVCILFGCTMPLMLRSTMERI